MRQYNKYLSLGSMKLAKKFNNGKEVYAAECGRVTLNAIGEFN